MSITFLPHHWVKIVNKLGLAVFVHFTTWNQSRREYVDATSSTIRIEEGTYLVSAWSTKDGQLYAMGVVDINADGTLTIDATPGGAFRTSVQGSVSFT